MDKNTEIRFIARKNGQAFSVWSTWVETLEDFIISQRRAGHDSDDYYTVEIDDDGEEIFTDNFYNAPLDEQFDWARRQYSDAHAVTLEYEGRFDL